jgi:plastocyanin
MLLAAALSLLGLWSVPARTAAAPAKVVTIVIDGVAFGAPDGEIHAGDTVKWINKDVVDHTATDTQRAWRVEIRAGASASLVLKKAGAFDYYCEYHPNMTGHLVVK